MSRTKASSYQSFRKNFKRLFASDRHLSRAPEAVFFRGAAHWIANNSYSGFIKPTHLVSLDFDTKTFKRLELPLPLDQMNFGFLFLLKESLAVFVISSTEARIWILQQDDENQVWMLWFSGPSDYGCTRGLNCLPSKAFYYERHGGAFIIYGSKSYNIVNFEVQDIEDVSWLEAYTDNLMLCNDYKAFSV